MKLRLETWIALSFLALAAPAYAVPSEGTLGKVDETPLLDETAPAPVTTPTSGTATASTETPTAPAIQIDPSPAVARDSSDSEADLKSTVNALREKLTLMEARVEELTRKLNEKSPSGATKNAKTPLRTEPVPVRPSDKVGIPVSVQDDPSDPEAGYANDATIQAFRDAMILHRAGKYTEAVLAFSSFVENYPDHPLAGTAQFYVGNSYFKQKEYGLAIQEYQRVLTTYDRSTHIAQTLREISDAEEAVRKIEDAAKHRQLLLSLFPHSPFAAGVTALAPAPETSALPKEDL